MRIGMLVTSIGNFGQKGFYNTQEIGLAKAMDKLFEEVIVYKAVPLTEKKQKITIEGCIHSSVIRVPVKNWGINGVWKCEIMDTSLDVLIYFSDTQIAVPKIYNWCNRNGIKLYPYIGVIESHSTSIVKKFIIDILFKRNINVYKKCTCFAKTPTVVERLEKLGIKRTVLTPVGLDESLLFRTYQNVNVNELKAKYGYSDSDKVILFVGRMIDEKQPIRMIEILSEMIKKNSNYKLLMIGTGELHSEVIKIIQEKNVENQVSMMEKIPNCNIWEVYRIANCFVNLNQQEIFGMAILEAMFYGCKVVAWRAPGPNLIIEDGVSGWLVESNDEVVTCVENKKELSSAAHKRVVCNFMWNNTANKMAGILRGAKK